MRNKGIIIVLLPFFLIFSFSCAHQSGKKYTNYHEAQVHRAEEFTWWQKEENQWLISALFILGIGIAISASIIIIYNSGGLFISIKK